MHHVRSAKTVVEGVICFYCTVFTWEGHFQAYAKCHRDLVLSERIFHESDSSSNPHLSPYPLHQSSTPPLPLSASPLSPVQPPPPLFNTAASTPPPPPSPPPPRPAHPPPAPPRSAPAPPPPNPKTAPTAPRPRSETAPPPPGPRS